jgi:hypothetical protein
MFFRRSSVGMLGHTALFDARAFFPGRPDHGRRRPGVDLFY